VQFQGDSSAASYGGAGGAAGAIDEDDDGKQCTGHALTLQLSVSSFRLLCFLPRSCAVSSSDALLQWCTHLLRPLFACCTQRYNGIETQVTAVAFLQSKSESLMSAIVLQMYLSSQALTRQSNSLACVLPSPPCKRALLFKKSRLLREAVASHNGLCRVCLLVLVQSTRAV